MTVLDELAPDVDIDAAFAAFRSISDRRRHRRRTIRLGTAAVAVVVVVGAALLLAYGLPRNQTRDNEAGLPKTTTLRVPTDVASDIHDAQLVRPVLIDNGALRLDPTSARPQVSESAAIRSFRAGAMPFGEMVTNVNVVYAQATLRIAVHYDARVLHPQVPPVFMHRPAWVVIWHDGGVFHCDRYSKPRVGVPPSEHVELLAADDTGEGVEYTTFGTGGCGGITPRTAVTADYWVSLPWTVASRVGTLLVLRYPTTPACAFVGMVPSDGDPTGKTFGVYEDILIARPPCINARPSSANIESAATTDQLRHFPIGIFLGRTTRKPGQPTAQPNHPTFSYFDGTTHSVE
jgi:hypothetical protein